MHQQARVRGPHHARSVIHPLLALGIALALGGCSAEDEPPARQPAIEDPIIAPPSLPKCSVLDRSSCSTRGHSSGCDNGAWRPQGRPGQSGFCVCDGHTNTCG
jgi:hypothetical protein